MGRFPDANAAEALRRIPGVSLEIDQGEGRFVVIRGVDASLNNVTLNGQIVGTPAEFGTRGVSMDSVPADLISRLEVTKAVTPDMDANAIGASVNIKTLGAFDRPNGLFSGTFRTGYNDLSGRAPFSANATYGRAFGADRRLGIVARRQLLESALRLGPLPRVQRHLVGVQRVLRAAESGLLPVRRRAPPRGIQRHGLVSSQDWPRPDVPRQPQPVPRHRRPAADGARSHARHTQQSDADVGAVQPGPRHARVPRLRAAPHDRRADDARQPRGRDRPGRLAGRLQPRRARHAAPRRLGVPLRGQCVSEQLRHVRSGAIDRHAERELLRSGVVPVPACPLPHGPRA